MRFRVLHLPGDQFVIIADRVPDDLVLNPEEGADVGLMSISADLIERLRGCGGLIATNETVEMEAWFPYG